MSPLAQYVVQSAVTLVGVGLLAWLIVFAGRRFGLPRDGGALKLRGRLSLDGRRAIYLVEVSGRVLVLGASEGGLTKLAELDGSELPERSAVQPHTFAEVLSRVMGRSASDRGADAPDALGAVEAADEDGGGR